MTELHGIYSVLTAYPILGVGAILITLSTVLILVGRDIFEGLPYNVAYASSVGDLAIVFGVLVGIQILQRGQVQMPYFLWHPSAQVGLGMSCFVLCLCMCIKTLRSRKGKGTDIYHDVIVAPLLLYLSLIVWPVVSSGGTRGERYAFNFAAALWAGLGVFDILCKRINQRPWLERLGLKFKK